MATGAMDQVVTYLRKATRPRAAPEATDGELLRVYLAQRSESAFEVLVRRHGGMVLGVCKRILGNVHDAEDAFQATFLVLARKGGSVVPREQVGNWLHGVALRTALEARARRARRRSRELQVTDMPHPTARAEVDWEALHRLLDQELGRLPARYRSALVLCDLEGRSRKQAAGQLGLPEGTLSSRLATGRQMLLRRLLRQGVSLPAAGLTAALGTHTSASVSPALVSAAARAALTAGAPAATGLFSAQVLSLSQGVLKTMFLHRLKMLAVLLLGIAFGAAGVGSVAVPAKGQAINNVLPVVARTVLAQRPEPDEPLDGRLLLDEQIQKELRLSPNQVKRLKETAAESERRNQGVHKEIEDLQKRIVELQKQAQSLHEKMQTDRDHAVRDAAPDILSPRAIARLRQIQRQNRGPEAILKDPRMQRLLKLDDEQMMKIEKTLKESPRNFHYQVMELETRVPIASSYILFNYNDPSMAKLAEVLTPEQRRSLQALLGEPYSTNWNWLWPEKDSKGGK